MFVIGLMVLIWAVRRPNPRKLILARFDALIIQGGELLFHGNSPVVDVRYRDWMARVTALLVNTFDPSVAESLIKDPPDRTLPNAVVLRFHQQLDRLTIIREQFMSGEIKARIKKDSWYSLQ
jgi:hypothetical protein